MFFLENILKHVMFYNTQGRNAPYILFYWISGTGTNVWKQKIRQVFGFSDLLCHTFYLESEAHCCHPGFILQVRTCKYVAEFECLTQFLESNHYKEYTDLLLFIFIG